MAGQEESQWAPLSLGVFLQPAYQLLTLAAFSKSKPHKLCMAFIVLAVTLESNALLKGGGAQAQTGPAWLEMSQHAGFCVFALGVISPKRTGLLFSFFSFQKRELSQV